MDSKLQALINEYMPRRYYGHEARKYAKIIAEEYAATKAQEYRGKCTIPVVSGSLPLASGSVTKTREPLPTYHNKCDLCGEIFWTKDAFNNKCPECGREGWQSNDR